MLDMRLPLLNPELSRADFLAWEADQAVKHEFLAGEVFYPDVMVSCDEADRRAAGAAPAQRGPAPDRGRRVRRFGCRAAGRFFRLGPRLWHPCRREVTHVDPHCCA